MTPQVVMTLLLAILLAFVGNAVRQENHELKAELARYWSKCPEGRK